MNDPICKLNRWSSAGSNGDASIQQREPEGDLGVGNHDDIVAVDDVVINMGSEVAMDGDEHPATSGDSLVTIPNRPKKKKDPRGRYAYKTT